MDADIQTYRRLNMLIEQYVEVKALDEMIAASAVAHGLGVVFDSQVT